MGKTGYLKESASSSSGVDSEVTPEQLKLWRERESKMYREIASFCAMQRARWEETVGVLVADVDSSTFAGSIAAAQFNTDRRLLLRCEEVMEARAAALETQKP